MRYLGQGLNVVNIPATLENAVCPLISSRNLTFLPLKIKKKGCSIPRCLKSDLEDNLLVLLLPLVDSEYLSA